MVYDRESAARRAESSTTNSPGFCQSWTRNIFGAPSAGDVDRDGDADAVDGWKSEPLSARHEGDRNPPRGVPVAWSGGSKGHGHRAVSLGNGKIRSTDAGGLGHVATVDLNWPEVHWGMRYLGWSETISGLHIPKPLSRGANVDAAITNLMNAKAIDGSNRQKLIDSALASLLEIEAF